MQYDKLIITNDRIGTVGVQVAECRTESLLLWEDPTAERPFKKQPDGFTATYGLEETGFSPKFRKIIEKIEKWKKLSISEKIKSAHPMDREKLAIELRKPCPTKNFSEASAPTADANGCTDGRQMMYVEERTGFLGLGAKKQVPIGCMTQEELNRWNYEQEARTPAYIPPVQVPQYQPPRVLNCTTQYGVTRCF